MVKNMIGMVKRWAAAAAVVFVLMAGGAGPARADSCTVAEGQASIDTGKYQKAIAEFTCVIEADPTGVDGYRGRIEAQLMLGRFSDAVSDYTRVTAYVVPVHPDAMTIILNGYDARLAVNPDSLTALTGKSFAFWWDFKYASAIHTLNHLLEVDPGSVFGNLFRGSSRLLSGATKVKGAADLEMAIALAPNSPDVHFIVADAYTYGFSDPNRAFAEAMLALDGGLNTPRVHAILAAAYTDFGDGEAAAEHIRIHIDMVTTDLASASPIEPGDDLALALVPGRTYAIPVDAAAGEAIRISTGSKDFWDTILVLVGPDGAVVAGSDDTVFYFAALDLAAQVTGTYTLLVTSFESANTGELQVGRD